MFWAFKRRYYLLCSFERTKFFSVRIAQNSVVAIARRIHLFPCRTQKLSFLAPIVVGGKLPARIGRCHAIFDGGLAQLGEHLPYKQRVTGSSPVTSIESLAQLVEHLTFNQRVDSSSLSRLIGQSYTPKMRVWRNWQTR